MSGLTVVYVVFAITVASMFGYLLLLSRREREVAAETAELRELGYRGDAERDSQS